MRKNIFMLCIIFIVLLILFFAAIFPPEASAGTDTLVTLEDHYWSAKAPHFIVYDRYTGVMYYMSQGSFYPLLDENGKPRIYSAQTSR